MRIAQRLMVMTLSGIGITLLLLYCVFSSAAESKVTQTNFFRLARGMTLEEVETVFGEKGETWHLLVESGSDRWTRKCWVGEGVAYLIFDRDHRLSGMEWHQNGCSSPTKTAFDRVRVGMTRIDVERVFRRAPDFVARDHESWDDFDGQAIVNYTEESVSLSSWAESIDYQVEYERTRPFRRLLRRIFDPQ